jgi:hypothetical protein
MRAPHGEHHLHVGLPLPLPDIRLVTWTIILADWLSSIVEPCFDLQNDAVVKSASHASTAPLTRNGRVVRLARSSPAPRCQLASVRCSHRGVAARVAFVKAKA